MAKGHETLIKDTFFFLFFYRVWCFILYNNPTASFYYGHGFWPWSDIGLLEKKNKWPTCKYKYKHVNKWVCQPENDHCKAFSSPSSTQAFLHHSSAFITVFFFYYNKTSQTHAFQILHHSYYCIMLPFFWITSCILHVLSCLYCVTLQPLFKVSFSLKSHFIFSFHQAALFLTRPTRFRPHNSLATSFTVIFMLSHSASTSLISKPPPSLPFLT